MQRGKISFKWNRTSASTTWQRHTEDAAPGGDLLRKEEDDPHDIPEVRHVTAGSASLHLSNNPNSDVVNQQIRHDGVTTLASSLLAQLIQDGNDIASLDSLFNVSNLSNSSVSCNVKSSVPDGLGLIKYQAPDVDSFVFDPKTGYRFDPTTGLHYDANSGFFINHDLELLLRWDPLSNTYVSLSPATVVTVPSALPQTSGALHMTSALNNQQSNANIPPIPVTVVPADAVRRITATAFEGCETRTSSSEAVVECCKLKHLPVNPAKQFGYGGEYESNASWSQQRTSEETRDRSERSRSGSPTRRRKYSSRIQDSMSRSRSPVSSKQSKEWPRRRRSVSRERIGSRSKRRSRSRDARRVSAGFRKNRSRSRSPGRHQEGRSRDRLHSDSKQLEKSNSCGNKRKGDVFSHLDPCTSEKNHCTEYATDSQRECQTSIVTGDSNLSRHLSHGRDANKSTLSYPNGKYMVMDECQQTLDNEQLPANEVSAPREPPAPREAQSTEIKVIDVGDVLGHLFTSDSSTITNLMLVAPVPLQSNSPNERAALAKQAGDPKDVLKCYVSHEKTSGSPCHFMVVSFKTANAAKQWYDSQAGTIVLSGEDGCKMRAYLHFLKKGNWNCKHCKSFNFFMQSICPTCYRAKDDGFSPVSISEEPTVLVGITKLKGTFSTVESVTESLPPLNAFNILSTEMIREPTGLPLGLCIFEVESSEEGSKLHQFFLQQGRIAVYVTLNEKSKTPDELYLDLLFDRLTPTNTLLVALIPLSSIPDIKFELTLMEMYLLTLLKEDGVGFVTITVHIDKNVGAPYSYGLITFVDAQTAALWLKSRSRTFQSGIRGKQPSLQGKNERSKISVHFSEDNWQCQSCHALNFFLRSLCHGCFKHRLKSRLGPMSQASVTTRYVAISELSSWSKADEYIVSHFRQFLKAFKFKKIEVVRDSKCQPLPLACVFEMQDKEESVRLREFLSKEGKFPRFIVMHKELDERTSIDPSGAPDVMIVDEPPPCIDLTSEDKGIQHNENAGIECLPQRMTPISEKPTAASVELTAGDNVSQPVQAGTPVREKPPPVSIELTAGDNLSQPVHTGTPIREKPPPVSIELTAGDSLSQPVQEGTPIREKPPPVSVDLTDGGNRTQLPRKIGSFRPPSIVTPISDQPFSLYRDPVNVSQYPPDCIISVSPVDYHGRDSQQFYTHLFLNVGAECEFVEFCGKDFFGVPYNYCLVSFRSPQSAKKWYDKMKGFLKTTLSCSKNGRPKLDFLGGNWSCHCGLKNWPKRSICFKCYTQRGKDRVTLTYSAAPTKYLGVNFLKWNVNTLSKLKCCLFDLVSVRFIRDPMMEQDHFAIHILETKSPGVTARLYEIYNSAPEVRSASFVEVHDPNAGTVVDLKRDLNVGNLSDSHATSSDGLEPRVMVSPDYETFLWTTLYAFRLSNPPTNVVMIPLCPGNRELPDEARTQILTSLKKAGVNHENILYSYKRDVGSPFSYCMVPFATQDSAKTWFDKCAGTFQFDVPCPADKETPLNFQNCFLQKTTSIGDTPYFIKSTLHYSLPNWLCTCGTSNFPLRMVCHKCFENKIENTTYVSVSDATNYVGIRLAEFLDERYDGCLSTFENLGKLGYATYSVHICLDTSFPRDPHGIVIIQTLDPTEGTRLHEFLADLIFQPSDEQPQDTLIGRLRQILRDSLGVTFLKCQPPLESSQNFIRSEKWDSLFKSPRPTNIIAVYTHISVSHIMCDIPFEPYGGQMKKFRAGVSMQGFLPTFWMIYFPSPRDAKKWYDANGGKLKNENYQPTLYFTDDFWMCRNQSCRSKNFPARVLCHGCYKHKMESGYSPLQISNNTPTRWVGITRPCDQKEAFVLANMDFQFRSIRIITDPNVHQDGTSIFVFEVSTPSVGLQLRNFFAKENFKPSFFEVSERA